MSRQLYLELRLVDLDRLPRLKRFLSGSLTARQQGCTGSTLRSYASVAFGSL
ncbi:MAG TPA: hypothetical protein VIH88_15225 [Candidatus Acidoferrales bacterium]|jgi:hypothetical protein